ncbi:MAG: hypothetical protein KAR01_10205 [Desulfocapsa sp.]|nr:hypothetical protein [Desulfocapsa sp.]
MNQTVKLTSKRQATFPVQLCQDLGVTAGDDLILERKKIDGEIAWLLKPRKKTESKWFGGLQKYSAGKDHDMESIRCSIGKTLGSKEI